MTRPTHERAPLPIAGVLATGQVQAMKNHVLLVARDGTRRPIGDSAAPIHDASGAVTGVVLVFRDMSAEYEVQRLTRDRNTELRGARSTSAPPRCASARPTMLVVQRPGDDRAIRN